MSALPRPESYVNGANSAAHTPMADPASVMGSSSGAAAREAQIEAQLIALGLRAVKAEEAEAALDAAAFTYGRFIRHGLIDRTAAGDLLSAGARANPHLFRLGDDSIQAAIAAGFRAGEEAATEERKAEEEREAADRAAQADREAAEATAVTWPTLDPRAVHGVAGELAGLATANTEADPVAVLATALTWAGAAS